MTERSTIHQITQLGVETVPGTSVTAGTQLQATSIEPSIHAEIASFRPMGGKFPVLAALGTEWVEASISGQAAYNDLAYLLAGLLSYEAPAPQGTGAYLWTFSIAQGAEDTIKTFTVEHGCAQRAAKFTYGLITSLGLSINRDNIDLSGSMLGQALQDDIERSPVSLVIPPVPILPTQIDVYLDDVVGSLGSTQLTRALSAELQISDRFAPLWALNSAASGYVAHVETAPTATLKLLLAADDAGMEPLAAMREGAKRYIRLEATGPVIADSERYRLQLDMCGTVSAVGRFSDEDGVYAVEWEFATTYDADWEQALTVQLVNTLSAL